MMKYGYFKAEEFSASKVAATCESDRTVSPATCTSTRSRVRPRISGPR